MTDQFESIVTPELELVFWPGCGGRLISLRACGVEFLWRNPDYLDRSGRLVWPREEWPVLDGSMGSWSNVGGSKTWPAPQGWAGPEEWPGPPDDRLDSGVWQAERQVDDSGETHLRMISPDDDRTGLRVVREFWVPPSGTSFRQRNSFHNIGGRPVTWSIWEVCQVDTEGCAGGAVRVGTDHSAAPLRMLGIVGEPSLGHTVGDELVLPIEDVVGKLGFPSAIRHVTLDRPDGRSLGLRFDAVAGAAYPDGGSRVELWMQYPIPDPLARFDGLHPRARLIELEVLGPLSRLEPNETATLDLRWEATCRFGPR